jgi:hypothetical protein
MLHPGAINVFPPNAEHLYRAGSSMEDYHGQMNAENFEKWIVEKWILSLLSVTVLNSAFYHCLQIEKLLSAYTKEADMISWFCKKGMNCNKTM